MCIFKIHLPEIIKTSVDSITTVQDITVNKVEHISPSAINDELPVDDSKYKEMYGFNLSNGEVANFLSHRETWKQFLETGLPWCLIVESNVFLKCSIEQINQTIQKLPDDWDVFFPYDLEKQLLQRRKQAYEQNLININHWEIGRKEPYLLGYKQGNSVYMLSDRGAAKLLSIKIIEDRLDHTIINMLNNDRLNVYNSDVDWFDISMTGDYNWPDRCRLVYNLALKQSSWNDSRLEKARKLLKTISDIAHENSINLMLEAGTLLGHIRHDGIMMWDDDIDIGIEEKDIDLFFARIEKNRNLRYGGEYRYRGTRYFKVWDIEGEEIKGYPYTFPFVDIWAYKYIRDDLVFENGITYPNTARAGMNDVIFEGARYKIPKNSMEALDSRFTDWRGMIRVYTWSHQSERNIFKYLYIPIKTDQNGRMIDFG